MDALCSAAACPSFRFQPPPSEDHRIESQTYAFVFGDLNTNVYQPADRLTFISR